MDQEQQNQIDEDARRETERRGADAQQAFILRGLRGRLSDADQRFADSLLGGFAKWGSFTPNQKPYVEKLIARASGQEPKEIIKTIPAPVVWNFFKTAFGVLKHPKVDLGPVVFAFRGAYRRYPERILLRDAQGAPLGEITYSAAEAEGVFRHVGGQNEETRASIERLVLAFNKDPIALITKAGKTSGRCALCRKELTDPESVARGIGPICIKNWNVYAFVCQGPS